MKRFAAGFATGLLLAGSLSVAEWGWGDMDVLKRMDVSLTRIAVAVERIAAAMPKLTQPQPCRNKVGAVVPCPEAP